MRNPLLSILYSPVLQISRCVPVALAATFLVGAAFGDEVRFNRDIRPLLSDRCFQCHGPDEGTREKNLRLDDESAAFAARGDRGAAIIPGDSAGSAFYRRISATDPDRRMPPPGSGKTLSEAEIETLRSWIDAGAKWEAHWSFLAPERPAPPQTSHDTDSRNPIDRFIRERLESEGLRPSPEAERSVLARRVALDLTGLSPAPGWVQQFVDDPLPGAYERYLDRLLKSPAFGEHFGRYWLDLARYGDTHGLHLDNIRLIWPYRDWVVDAYNRNMPFDEFTIEQLAGDLLPDHSRDQLVATGFNRCNVTTGEGGSINEEYYVRYAVDRVETTSTVWLGLTAGCAVCHDHKFDPVTQKDFYSMFAFFNSLTEEPMDKNARTPPPFIELPSPEEVSRRDDLNRLIAEATEALEGPNPELDEAQKPWEKGARALLNKAWQVVQPLEARAASGPALEIREGGVVTAPGSVSEKDTYEVTLRVEGTGYTAVRLEVFRDDELASGGPGFAESGNFVLSEFEVTASSVGSPERSQVIRFRGVVADFEQGDWEVRKSIDGSLETGWGVSGGQGKDHEATFLSSEPFGYDGETEIRVLLRQDYGRRYLIKNFRLSVSSDAEFAVAEPDEPALERARKLLELNGVVTLVPGQKDDEKERRVYYRQRYWPEWPKVEERLARYKKDLERLESDIPKTLVMEEREERRDAFVLERGAYDKKGEKVSAAVPAVFQQLPEASQGTRLDLARWLMRPDHPLTARVTVNRLWQRLFGTGLVKTLEDFGSQGEWPSHPELLDWLATEFVRQDWNVQGMIKLMMTSATYRQSSKVTPELIARDPENRLLSRGSRFRPDAEVIRDNALALGGLLVRRMGGPGVRPYQPGGLWKAVAFSDSNTNLFVQDHGERLYRRSLYTFWKRTSPPPAMAIFDAPTRESCTVSRSRTNTPLQALVLLNDTQFVEAARWMARRVLHEGGDETRSRIDYSYRIALSRPARADEKELLGELHDVYLNEFRGDPERARQLTAVGEASTAFPGDASELATWTLLCSLIMNLDEVLTKN